MLPNKHGVDAYLKFIVYSQELASNYNRLQNFYKDKYVTQDAYCVLDFKDAGMPNLSIDFQIKVAMLLWSSYVLTTHKIYMVNVNWVLTSTFVFVRPLLPTVVSE